MVKNIDRSLSFEDHRRELGNFLYVYPVLSRRAQGVSVGINLNPDKGCNFDCVYCQVDRSGKRPPPQGGFGDPKNGAGAAIFVGQKWLTLQSPAF